MHCSATLSLMLVLLHTACKSYYVLLPFESLVGGHIMYTCNHSKLWNTLENLGKMRLCHDTYKLGLAGQLATSE